MRTRATANCSASIHGPRSCWASASSRKPIIPPRDLLGAEELTKYLAEFRASILQTVARMPVHQDFVNQYCKASNSVWN